jgi:acetyl esterase
MPLDPQTQFLLQQMEAAGVPTTLTRYSGVIHDFVMMAGAIDLGQRGIDEAIAWLKGVFAH